MKYVKKIILSFFFLGIFSFSVYSQSQTGIKGILASIDTFKNRSPAEKLYLHFDKPYYSTGDTMWFKAYLFDITLLTASEKSGIVYMELANDTNKVLLRRMLRVEAGLGRGNIVLNKEDVPEGSYTIRAYTNLMRNFGEVYVFRKSIYVGGSSDQSWLINSDIKISKDAGKDNLRLGLQFRDVDKKPVGLHELQVRVLEGRKVLLRDKVQTDVDGKLDVNFNLPEKVDTKNISIVAEDASKLTTHKIIIPVPVNRYENTDLQFMPEGGNLVNGIATRVGFKAIGEDGKGADVSGKIYNSTNQEVAVFATKHNGIGSFEFTPKAGENYTARVIFPGGSAKTYPLPGVKNSGTVLRIINRKESDSLEVIVSISPELTASTSNLPAHFPPYYLLGQYGNVVCYGGVLYSSVKVKVAKRLFVSGIAHFSLISAGRQPLNERLVYIDHQDGLKISVQTDKASYKAHDSIALNIQVSNKEGKPVIGSFSIAVTDDAQVNTDSLNSTLLTDLLLTSDLKGNIESPGYYFEKQNEQTWNDLDDLLLTQGWVGYDWQKVFNPKLIPEYAPEPQFTVKGKATNVLNKGLAGTKVMLVSIKPLFFMDTITNNDGTFAFDRFPEIDSVVFKLQASNKKGKQNNVGIQAEDFKPPVFENGGRSMPWYVNSDTTLLNYVKSTVDQQKEAIKFAGNGNLLNEVTIAAKKMVKGSKNLHGIPDIVLDETDTKKAGKITLLQLIQQRIPMFSEKTVVGTSKSGITVRQRLYLLNGVPVGFGIDGIDLDFFYSEGSGGHFNGDDHYWYIRDYLERFSAEDIMGVELRKYRPQEPPWIEITTRSGNGVFMKNTPGTYLFKTMPFAGSKQFYSPRYSLKNNKPTVTDRRSTIFWEPDVITDAEGKAVVSFYSADGHGTYTVITEGTDMIGDLGSKRDKIVVER